MYRNEYAMFLRDVLGLAVETCLNCLIVHHYSDVLPALMAQAIARPPCTVSACGLVHCATELQATQLHIFTSEQEHVT